jgi:hypothetical protein
MGSSAKYMDEPLGQLEIVPDFLPSPDELEFREQSISKTIAPSKKDVAPGARDKQPG